MAINQEKTAMNRRKYNAQRSATIALQGLKGKLVAKTCLEHQISQRPCYKWRDQFLANVNQVFTDKEKMTGE
jgi:transposase-like protein